MSAFQKLRIGTVPYLVARPLDDGLESDEGIELHRDVPARLVEGLREGRLDVALVSSIELFRRPGYRYLAGIGIAGEREVRSVQVFLRRPLEEVRTVALDPASRTGAVLTRITMRRALDPPPEFLEVEQGADPREVEADAWLRIGDEALRESLARDAPPTFDPAAAWREQTGLPFVFAVWAARPEVDLEPWVGRFARARQRGLARREELAREAAREWSLPLEACRAYLLEEVKYTMDPLRQSASLLAFRDAAALLDQCGADLRPAALPVPPPSGPGPSPI